MSAAAIPGLDLGGVRVYWLDGGGFRLDGGALFGPVPRLHLPHAGGLLDGSGEPAFANARVWAQRLELSQPGDATHRRPDASAAESFDRLTALGLTREVDGEAEVTPHVRVHLTGGHSR